jgi:hypothetical protein
MKADLKKIWNSIKDKKNVLGYSESIKTRIKNGKTIDGTKVMRIYVSKKERIENLEAEDIIPKIMDGIEIDVVEIGELKALNETNISNKKEILQKNHH